MKEDVLYESIKKDLIKYGLDTIKLEDVFKTMFEEYKNNIDELIILSYVLKDLWDISSFDKSRLKTFYKNKFEYVNEYIILHNNFRDLDYYFERVG